MRKESLLVIFVSIVIVAAGAVLSFFRRKEPPRADIEKTPPRLEERNYSPQDRKAILLSLIAQNPELWRKRYILGGIYIQEGDFRRAAEQFQEIIKINPGMIKAYNALGMCYLNLGENSEAVAAWKKALEIDPENAQAADLIARVERAQTRSAERRGLEILVEKEPERPDAWFRLGEIYLKEKRYDLAVSALEKATRLAPDRAQYFYRLGYACHRMQDYEQAETALKTARVLDPGNDKIERLLKDVRAKQTNLRN
jgi:cytochrome c-type biogenesis protein CcmH/NrfG